MKSLFKSVLLLAAISILWTSCDKDKDDDSYTIPTTYNFDNVSYSGQTQRLAMFTEMKSYMATSQTLGVSLDADRLKAMYANDAANAMWVGSYEESKQLKSKTFEIVQADFDALLDELAAASQSTVVGSEGVSGVIESNDGSKSYLVGDDGLDHAQIFEKSLMGACLYYQATGVYMESGKMDVDNETIEPGTGTMMEHHWDEAFGYFGVPLDFPSNTDNLAFWGSYSNKRNSVLGCNQIMMDALLKGRAAICNNDLETRDQAIDEARTEWERISVGSALHYLNAGIEDYGDMCLFSHGVSEAIGFIYSLQFNPAKQINNDQINDLLTLIAGSSDFDQMNLYNTTISNIIQARDDLATYYGFKDIKEMF